MEYTNTTHPTSWFKAQYAAGALTLKPPYQRKPVWTAKQKCYLIESILLRLPIPEIFVQMTTTPEGYANYAIVDGQQRIRTVLQFIGSEEDPHEEEFNKFILDKLAASSPWRNKTFADLADDVKTRFYEYEFAVRYLKARSDDDICDVFIRLNKYLTALNPQELRNATYSGPFCKLAEKLADDEYWAENTIVSPAQIRRMKDIEFVSNLLIGVLHGPQGGDPKTVDEYYYQYEDCEDEFPDQKRAKSLFDSTLKTVKLLLHDIKSTRWSNMTDFYTLFVGVAAMLRSGSLPHSKLRPLRKALDSFAQDINLRLGDESARVNDNVIKYVRAVEKGANDKKRRADRQEALLATITKFFTDKKQ